MFGLSILFKRGFINYKRISIEKIHSNIVETRIFKNIIYKGGIVLYYSAADYISSFLIK